MKQSKFDLHLPGLIKILAENLYSDPRVGVRELLQNAHDSISRRQIEDTRWKDEPRVQVTIDRARNSIEISDNGSGLTHDETVTYLATIGRGYTRELRDRMVFEDPEKYKVLIGQFGLGFLSAFLLAESVEVETLSYRSGAESVIWRSQGGESYQLLTGHREDVGTTVRLTLKPSMRFLLDEPTLTSLVRRFADLLPHPVYVGTNRYRVNSGAGPWCMEDPEESLNEFLRSRSLEEKPLWFMLLRDHTIEFNQESITVPLSGIIYIPQRSVASVQEHGDSIVFIRNMFIRERDRRLLPAWARFACGIIESSMLTPTASREDIHEDENLQLVTQAIEQQFLDALVVMSHEQPRQWDRILESHANLMMAWAAENDEFFHRIVDQVRLPTSRGQLTIRDYLKQTKSRTIYYQADETPRLCDQVILEGCGKPVIDATWYGILPFLEKYESENPGVELLQADVDIPSLIRTVKDRKFSALVKRFEQFPDDVRVGDFEPAGLPAVLVYDPAADFLRTMDSLNQDSLNQDEQQALPPGVGSLLNGIANEYRNEGQSCRGTLFLNARSDLISELAKQATAGTLNESVCQMVYQTVRLFSGRHMSARECMGAWEVLSKSISGLMGSKKSDKE